MYSHMTRPLRVAFLRWGRGGKEDLRSRPWTGRWPNRVDRMCRIRSSIPSTESFTENCQENEGIVISTTGGVPLNMLHISGCTFKYTVQHGVYL